VFNPRKTVLVVEDNTDLRRLFADILKMSGFNVLEASDGTHALQMVESVSPDLIVLDIGLPTLDGYSVREEIAANADTKDIPIVVVTGTDVNLTRLKNVRILRKPIDLGELVVVVRLMLRSLTG
jgi:DNA-binding response OmpR family regulator